MTFEMPAAIEPEVMRYAEAEHITEAEAVVRLIKSGLDAQTREDARIHALLGDPLNEQDAALMDEVVDMAMKSRSERWGSKSSA